jgi:hypothetical protein
LFLGGLAVRNAVRGFASRGWPQVQGRVLRSFVLVDRHFENEFFTPQVEYEYQVDGTTYRRMVLCYGRGGSGNRRQAERVIAPYPPGARVPVFFDPGKPADAVLQRGTHWNNLAIALSAIAFLWAGFAFLLQAK